LLVLFSPGSAETDVGRVRN